MKNKALSYIMAVIFVLFNLGISYASNTTEATGTGDSRQVAINNALKSAVEQAVGVLIKGLTEVSNNELVVDKVSAASAGFVKNYEILSEVKDPVDNMYKIKIRATIDDIALKSAVDEFLKDPRAQRIFQETKFDERRVVVLYQPRTENDLPFKSKAVQKVMDLIQDSLTGYGFRVFLPEQLTKTSGKAVETVADPEIALNIARQENGDALVLVSFDAGKSQTPTGLILIMSELFLKAYDSSTGELFANVNKKAKTIAKGGNYGIDDGVATTTEKSGPEAVEALAKKIVERFSSNRAKFVTTIFKKIALADQEKVEDMLEGLKWRYKIVKQTGTNIEIEIFSESDPNSVKRTLIKAAKTSGLTISSAEIVGSRITFEGQ